MSVFDSLFGRKPRSAEPPLDAELHDADIVWNRALDADEWPRSFTAETPDGERHLWYMALFDAFAGGDGLMDAMSHMGSDGTRNAIDAFRWFGLFDLADLVERYWLALLPAEAEWARDQDIGFDLLDIESMSEQEVDALGDLETQFDLPYSAAAERITQQFREFYHNHPNRFDPV